MGSLKLIRGATGASLRREIEKIKRKKVVASKIVDLAEFRSLHKHAEPRTILVVDDDEIMRNAMKRILDGEGYRTVLAEDGMELSKVLESMKLDLVLLDVNLPWVDGFELCRLMKGHHALKHVPLVLVSGRKDKEDVEKGFDAGANDYITKPFDVGFMTNVINRLLTEDASEA